MLLTNLQEAKLTEQFQALEELVRRTMIIQLAYANPQHAQALQQTWAEYAKVCKSIDQDFSTDKVLH